MIGEKIILTHGFTKKTPSRELEKASCHMTQKELAEATGIDQSDISKIETGNANPALSTLMRLAEGMGIYVI